MRRAWGDAHAKVRREGACRACRQTGRVEAAHTVGRRYDKPIGPEAGEPPMVYVDPLDVVPLCPTCHRAYDAHQLDLVPVLTYAEQAAAVRHVGLVRALHRLTGGGQGGRWDVLERRLKTPGGDNAANLG